MPFRLLASHALLVGSSQLLPGRTASLATIVLTIHTIILVSFWNIPPHCCCIDCTILCILSPAPHNNTVYRTGGRLLHVSSQYMAVNPAMAGAANTKHNRQHKLYL